MASARNLCQHVDVDGRQCPSNNYILCPHCQLELCLKHLNIHQDLLRIDFDSFSNEINRLRVHLEQLFFDSTNHRRQLFQQLDHWYKQQIQSIHQIYIERKQQLEIVYLQAQTEFEDCKKRKETQLKDNLMKQFQRITAEKQIHIEDLNEMKCKLHDIERGVDELKQLMIEIDYDEPKINLQIIKRRYIEATKTSIDDDDEFNESRQ